MPSRPLFNLISAACCFGLLLSTVQAWAVCGGQGTDPLGASCAAGNDCCSLNCGVPQAGMCGTAGAPNCGLAGCCKGDEPSIPPPPPGVPDINWCNGPADCCTGNCQQPVGATHATCCSAGPNPGGVAGVAQACVVAADCCLPANAPAFKCGFVGEATEKRCEIPDDSTTNCLNAVDCYSGNCHANDPRPGLSTCRCQPKANGCGQNMDCCPGLYCDGTNCTCLSDNANCSVNPCCAGETCGTLQNVAYRCCASTQQSCGHSLSCCDGESCVATQAQFNSNTGSCCIKTNFTGCTSDSQCCSTNFAGDSTCWLEQGECVLYGTLQNGAKCRSDGQCASGDCGSGGTCLAKVGDAKPCSDSDDCSAVNEICGVVGGVSKCCVPNGAGVPTKATCCDGSTRGANNVCLISNGFPCGGGGGTEKAKDATCSSGDCRNGTCTGCGNASAGCSDSDDCCTSLACDTTASQCVSCIPVNHSGCSGASDCCYGNPCVSGTCQCSLPQGSCSTVADCCGGATYNTCYYNVCCVNTLSYDCYSNYDCCSLNCNLSTHMCMPS
jgi:hypothetical protein